jgi:hypothetical protein
MKDTEFAALRGLVRDSALGKLLARGAAATHDATRTSLLLSLAGRLRATLTRWDEWTRWRAAGLLMVAAGLTHFALSRWQPAHQTPLAAPAVSGLVGLVGLALFVYGPGVGSAWASSNTRRVLHRLVR